MEKNVLSSPKKFIGAMEQEIETINSNKSDSNSKTELQFIGKTLHLVRKEKNLKLAALSNLTNTPISILSRYEHGTLIPNYQKLRLLCRAMDVDFLVFMFKCINEENIIDDRNRRTIKEYVPCVEEAKNKARNSFLN